METYENLKSYNFQEIIRFMNAKISDKIFGLLNKRLAQLINQHQHAPKQSIEQLVESFSILYRIFFKPEEKREIIIREYLYRKTQNQSKIVEFMEQSIMPKFIPISEISGFQIKIDTLNPLHPQTYIKMELYSKEPEENIVSKIETNCQHENEWNELQRSRKNESLNQHNMEVIQFMDKFALETTELDFVCRICGQILPLKQYVQDGIFDNNTLRFVTAYQPWDVPLEEVPEYRKYKLTIRYLDGLINRISFITGTSMLVGPSVQIKQKRKALVKNIVDLIIRHNLVNLKKKLNDEERLEFFSKKFHIDKDLDSVFFFELDDSIFNFTPNESSVNTDLNRLKFNNILLYFMLVFIAELMVPKLP